MLQAYYICSAAIVRHSAGTPYIFVCSDIRRGDTTYICIVTYKAYVPPRWRPVFFLPLDARAVVTDRCRPPILWPIQYAFVFIAQGGFGTLIHCCSSTLSSDLADSRSRTFHTPFAFSGKVPTGSGRARPRQNHQPSYQVKVTRNTAGQPGLHGIVRVRV